MDIDRLRIVIERYGEACAECRCVFEHGYFGPTFQQADKAVQDAWNEIERILGEEDEPTFLVRASHKDSARVVRLLGSFQDVGDVQDTAFRVADIMDEWVRSSVAERLAPNQRDGGSIPSGPAKERNGSGGISGWGSGR